MKLDVYILRQLAVAFAISAGGILFIALPGIAVTAVSRLAGVSTVAILKFIPMVVAGFMPHVLPIAFLISVVATYGRMAAESSPAITSPSFAAPSVATRPSVTVQTVADSTLWARGRSKIARLATIVRRAWARRVAEALRTSSPR